jgi:hypothetical protein
MMKKAIFLSAFVALMLSTQLIFAQPVSGSQLNLTNNYTYTHPKTGVTTNNTSLWNLKFIYDESLIFTTTSSINNTSSDILRLSSSGIYAEKTLFTSSINSSNTITSNSIIANTTLRSLGSITVGTNIGIGTTSPAYGLHLVNRDIVLSDGSSNQFKITSDGFVTARQINVNTTTIPDYVFEPDYNLMSLSEVDNYIKANKHLPNIKSASEYEAIGTVDINELQLKLLEKVEELTLHTIRQQKELEALKKQNEVLSNQLEQLNSK